MKLVTIVNKDHPGLKLWRETAAAHGYDATVLMDTAAVIGHESGKFGAKLSIIGDYVKTRGDEFIVVTDGFDVAFVEDASSLEKRLRANLQRDEMLFSGEVYANPDKGLPWSAGRFPYLNAGVYAGHADTILANLQPFFSFSTHDQVACDDQRYWGHRHFANPKIRVDVDGEFFASLLDVTTDVKAGVYHFQGFYKDLSVLEFTPHWQSAKAIHRPNTPALRFLDHFLDLVLYLVPWLHSQPRYKALVVIVAGIFVLLRSFRPLSSTCNGGHAA